MSEEEFHSGGPVPGPARAVIQTGEAVYRLKVHTAMGVIPDEVIRRLRRQMLRGGTWRDRLHRRWDGWLLR